MKLIEILKHMKLTESGGEKPGNYEINNITSDTAKRFFLEQVNKFKSNHDFSTFLLNFNRHFEKCKEYSSKGYLKRKEMPVIDINQINALQIRLEHGYLDVVYDDVPHKSFPSGLKNKQADSWLTRGLKDGSDADDVVKVTQKYFSAIDLIPLQEQIYFDKSIKSIVENGVENTIEFLKNESIIIVSVDGYIMDGHHRWMCGMLIDPNTKLRSVVVDLPRFKLIKLLNDYSDAIGNIRNE